MAKRKKQGMCIFCGGPSLTKEHIWSDWLKEVIKPTPDHNNEWKLFGFNQDGNWTNLGKRISKIRPGNLQQKKIRKVCKDCNNGWMSRLVDETKPVVKDLMAGKVLELSPEQQQKLSCWMVMSTMMAEFLNEEAGVIPKSDYTALFEKKVAPNNWFVFMGYHNAESWNRLRRRFVFNKLYDAAKAARGILEGIGVYQVTIYSLNHLLIVTASTNVRDLWAKLMIAYGHFPLAMIQPACAHSLKWPPAEVMNEDQINLLEQAAYAVGVDWK